MGASGSGYYLNSTTYSTFRGNVAYNRSGGAGTMAYGAGLTGTQTGLVLAANSFSCATGPVSCAGSGYTEMDPFVGALGEYDAQ